MVGVWFVGVFVLVVQLSEFRGVAGNSSRNSFGPTQLVVDYRHARKPAMEESDDSMAMKSKGSLGILGGQCPVSRESISNSREDLSPGNFSTQPEPGEIVFRLKPTPWWVRIFWPLFVELFVPSATLLP
jgi:hypothetical protein